MIDDYCPDREDLYWEQYEIDHCKMCIEGVPSNCFGCMYMTTTETWASSCILADKPIIDRYRVVCTPYDFTKRLLEII